MKDGYICFISFSFRFAFVQLIPVTNYMIGDSMKRSLKFLSLLVFFCVVFAACSTRQKELPITSKSDDAINIYIQAREALENAEVQDASRMFQDAIDRDNSFALAYLYRGITSESPAQVKANLESAQQLSGDISEGEQLVIKMEKAAHVDKDLTAAKEISEKLVAMFPRDKHLIFSNGWIIYSLGDNTAAIEKFKSIIKLDPEFGPAHNMLGICYMEIGNKEDAEKEFKEYLRLAPDRPNSYDSYAWFLEKTGHYDDAIANYNKALQYDDQFLSSSYGEAKCFILKGDYTKARDVYKKCYTDGSTAEKRLEALKMITRSYIYEDKLDLALKNISLYRDEAVKEKEPESVVLSYAEEGLFLTESGKAAEGLKKFEESMKMIDKVDMPKDRKEQLRTLLKMPLVYSYCMNNDLKKAREYAELYKTESEQKKLEGREDNLNLVLGLIDFKDGNYDAMIDKYKKVSKPDAQDKYYLAQAYLKKGDKESAKKLVNDILNSYDDSNQLASVWTKAKKEAAGL